MIRLAALAVFAMVAVAPPAVAQLDSGSGQQASRQLSTPPPQRHAKPAGVACGRQHGAKRRHDCHRRH
ncbi:hypothetical protein [Lichenicoccus sp.]|uniref:hypothetical protein n=1 Tax=Lichenicoccus sp. TaxID=2781899 RepID=UPI003D128D4F